LFGNFYGRSAIIILRLDIPVPHHDLDLVGAKSHRLSESFVEVAQAVNFSAPAVWLKIAAPAGALPGGLDIRDL
jgi:hypothetical protein